MADNLPGHGDVYIAPDGSEDAMRPGALEAFLNSGRGNGANQMLTPIPNDHPKSEDERSGDVQSNDDGQAHRPVTTGTKKHWRNSTQPRRMLEQEAQKYASKMREWKARIPGPWPLGVRPYDVLIELMRSPISSAASQHRTMRLFNEGITKTRKEPPDSAQAGWKTHPATFPAPEVIIATNILAKGAPWTVKTINFLDSVGATWMIDPTEKRTAWWAGFDLLRPTVAMKAIFFYTSNSVANTPPVTETNLNSFLAGTSSVLQPVPKGVLTPKPPVEAATVEGSRQQQHVLQPQTPQQITGVNSTQLETAAFTPLATDVEKRLGRLETALETSAEMAANVSRLTTTIARIEKTINDMSGRGVPAKRDTTTNLLQGQARRDDGQPSDDIFILSEEEWPLAHTAMRRKRINKASGSNAASTSPIPATPAATAPVAAGRQENHGDDKTARMEAMRHNTATDKTRASANPGTSSSARAKRTTDEAHEAQPSSKKQATAPGFRYLDWKEFQLFSISHGKAYFLDADNVSRVGRDITFAGGVMLATVDHESGSRHTPIKDVRGEKDAWLNEMGIWNMGQGNYKIGTVKKEEE